MDSIYISVAELLEKATELSEDGMKYVKLSLVPEDDDLPGCIIFSAVKNANDHTIIDYEEIEEASGMDF